MSLSKSTLIYLLLHSLVTSARLQSVRTPHLRLGYSGRRGSPSVPSGWAYLGCFGEPSGGRVLSTRALATGDLTTASCTAACDAAGYSYAGTEYGQECWCGNSLNQPAALTDSSCSMACSGDSTERCGAGYIISLYGKSSSGTDGWSDLGCYVDASDRTLIQASRTDDGMTVEMCKTICGAYEYAGVEAGRECYCGWWLQRNTTAPASDCNWGCAGDESETCGGSWRLSMHYHTATQSGGTYDKVGCFTDSDYRALSFSPGDAPPGVNGWSESTCTSRCRDLAYPYAGVEAGNECYCGTSIRTGSGAGQQVAESECATPCSANPSITCGGMWRAEIYYNSYFDTSATTITTTVSTTSATPTTISTTTVSATSTSTSATPTGYAHLGCYTDSTSDPALSYDAGYSPPHVNGWNQWMCQDKCQSKNYKYYGLESGYACHCGNEINQSSSSGQAVAQSECNTPCVMDSTLTCGGTNRIDIYYNSELDTSPSSGFVPEGCYVDSSDNRLLDTNVGAAPSGSNGWTFETCAGKCQELNKAYAGLEAGTECWCGSLLMNFGSDSGQKVPESECSTPCAGDSTETCGASWRCMVYVNNLLYETTHW